ncbi:hypothetical protein AB0K09_19325 [Streptomyces sp. NPDC049577]|uniref:hypothetical protein n=1 Tax=Streptomyces sp. NPDC049577 TaxID=3155153 RepID=UPI00342ABAE8
MLSGPGADLGYPLQFDAEIRHHEHDQTDSARGFWLVRIQESANPRASGPGVMIYWHVERKSVFIYLADVELRQETHEGPPGRGELEQRGQGPLARRVRRCVYTNCSKPLPVTSRSNKRFCCPAHKAVAVAVASGSCGGTS